MVTNLREIRKARGMTQEQLSKASGIHRVTIAKYEALRIDPKMECAERLATALGVTVADLIKSDNNPSGHVSAEPDTLETKGA